MRELQALAAIIGAHDPAEGAVRRRHQRDLLREDAEVALDVLLVVEEDAAVVVVAEERGDVLLAGDRAQHDAVAESVADVQRTPGNTVVVVVVGDVVADGEEIALHQVGRRAGSEARAGEVRITLKATP